MTTHKMVVSLLLLACTCMCTNTCEEIFTKKKSKYQDTICTEEGHGDKP